MRQTTKAKGSNPNQERLCSDATTATGSIDSTQQTPAALEEKSSVYCSSFVSGTYPGEGRGGLSLLRRRLVVEEHPIPPKEQQARCPLYALALSFLSFTLTKAVRRL